MVYQLAVHQDIRTWSDYELREGPNKKSAHLTLVIGARLRFLVIRLTIAINYLAEASSRA